MAYKISTEFLCSLKLILQKIFDPLVLENNLNSHFIFGQFMQKSGSNFKCQRQQPPLSLSWVRTLRTTRGKDRRCTSTSAHEDCSCCSSGASCCTQLHLAKYTAAAKPRNCILGQLAKCCRHSQLQQRRRNWDNLHFSMQI